MGEEKCYKYFTVARRTLESCDSYEPMGDTKVFLKELKKLKPLWFVVQTTGGTGIDTEFVAKSLDELNELIFEKINKIDGVIKTETSLFLNYIKRQYDWGTALY